MFKTTIKNRQSTRSPVLSLLFLTSLCIFSPLVAHNAHAAAAVNPSGSTIAGMDAGDGSAQDPAVVAPHPTVFNNPILENRGSISGGIKFTGSGGGAVYGGMFGITASNTSYTFSNFADINIDRATLTDIHGMYASAENGDHNFSNSGTINISGKRLLSGMWAYANNIGDHTLTNSGTIIVTGTEETIYGMVAWGQNGGDHKLTNSGTINVSGAKNVYGMRVRNAGTHTLNNIGTISATATAGDAFEAYGESTGYSVGTWATTLRTLTTNNSVFGANAGQTVNLANSTLVFRPQITNGVAELGVDYALDNLVVVNGVSANTQLGKIEAEVPFLKAVVTGGANTGTASVRLESNVSEDTTPGAATMQQAVAQAQGQFNNLSTSLRNVLVQIYSEANFVADSGTGVAAGSNFTPNNKWQVFLNPYANTVNNSKYDYNGNNMGITAGASYRVSDNFSFGGHLDFSSANYYGELMDASTKSTSFALGIHAAYNFTRECYLRGQLTGSVNQNDSYYELGGITSADADANYNGEAIYAELATGYIWQIAKGHSLTPEIGLSYLGTHTGAYDVKWGGAGSLYDMSYDDSYYNAFYGTLSLDWRSEWELKNDASIALLAGLGLRQTLSNGEMETNFRTLGSKYSTTSTEDLTTFLADVGVEYRKGNFSVSLNYDGGFGTKQTSHGGNVMVKLEF